MHKFYAQIFIIEWIEWIDRYMTRSCLGFPSSTIVGRLAKGEQVIGDGCKGGQRATSKHPDLMMPERILSTHKAITALSQNDRAAIHAAYIIRGKEKTGGGYEPLTSGQRMQW
ncbi:MAG: hypothetical protein GY750_17980, partial [Lentisphaerae bacterium]|nr:hypothetical protein [Lentisphaerota bacterium]